MTAAWLALAVAGTLPSIDDPLRTDATAPDDAAVIVGLEDYVFLPDVPHATNDAAAVEDFLVSTRGVPPGQVTKLTQAGREQILAAVDQASIATGTVWIYLAGHGVAAPSSGERLFLGDDARQDPAAFEARGLLLSELSDRAGANGASVVMLVDACFNGTAREGGSLVEGTRFAVPVYATEPAEGDLLFAASGPDQLARPLDAAGHGAFTYALLGALRGWADGEIDGRPDGQVTGDEAQVYVRRALQVLGIEDQRPELRGDGARPLSAGSLEPAPELEAVAASPRQQTVVLPGFDPDLVAAAAVYEVRLPLQRGPFGYKDADKNKVRRDTVTKLIRSTKQGRSGLRQQAVGIAVTAVGWTTGMGFAMGAFLAEDARYAIPALGGVGAGVSGMVLMVAGDAKARGSLDPR